MVSSRIITFSRRTTTAVHGGDVAEGIKVPTSFSDIREQFRGGLRSSSTPVGSESLDPNFDCSGNVPGLPGGTKQSTVGKGAAGAEGESREAGAVGSDSVKESILSKAVPVSPDPRKSISGSALAHESADPPRGFVQMDVMKRKVWTYHYMRCLSECKALSPCSTEKLARTIHKLCSIYRTHV